MPHNQFIKRNASVMGRWWWIIDHYLLGAVFLLIAIGILLNFSASPCVAQRIGFSKFFFVKHHLIVVPIAIILLILCSLLSHQNTKKLALLIFITGIIALIATHLWGHDVKNAKRWLLIFGISLQPSEFIKPALAVIVAWLLSERLINTEFPGIQIACFIVCIFMAFLIAQPDIGMTVITLISFLIQLFIAGIPLLFVIGAVILGFIGLITSYFCIPHVAHRINSFLHPEISDPDQMYQIRQSIEAFHHGRWFGCGPGEGIVKKSVPDAHSDFVFSVAGEEYGLFFCIAIVLLFAFIIVRSIMKSRKDPDPFTIFAVTGIVSQLGLQAFVNMATTLHLIPTKGMTMPFISYGGSSLLAVGIAIGMVLALTKKKYGLLGDT